MSPAHVVFSAGSAHEHPRAVAAQRYITHLGLDPATQMFRTDRGDNEGGKEWNHLSSSTKDLRGDDDVEITLPKDGGADAIEVKYRTP